MRGCIGCGKCCRQVVYTVAKAGREDLITFFRMHDLDVRNSEDGESVVTVIRAKCDWLSLATLRCKFYEKRPTMCREFLCDEALKD